MTQQEPVEALTPEMTGRWWVRTRRTTHLFDLDNGTYVRMPNADGQAFAFDGHPIRLSRIETWPAVGQRFFIWFDDAQVPQLLEHWRMSSTIRAIEPVEAPVPSAP